jgi:hypothetical protein
VTVVAVSLLVGVPAPAPAASAGSAPPILGLLQATVPNFAQERATGVQSVTIGAVWSLAQSSSATVFSSTYAGQIRAEIASARADGLSVVLDPGLQYPPSWAFYLNSQTHFVNQYGDVYSAAGSSGNNAINAITDAAVRSAEGTYLAWLASVIPPGSIIAVRQGGGPLGELHYPLAVYDGHTDSYWAYDDATQAGLPASVWQWRPGTGTVAQATTFLDAYNGNLDNYSEWLNGQLHTDFGVKELVMLPGWGERPDITPTDGPFYTVESDLLVPPNQSYPEFNEGLDWAEILPSLPDAADSVAYTTYLDAPRNPPGLPASLQLEDPADYLATLVSGTPLRLGGENSLSDQSLAALDLCMARAQAHNFYIVDWMGEDQLLATAAGTDPGDPTLGDLVQAYDSATGTGGPRLAVVTSSLPAGVEGQAYQGPLVAAAGDPPYTWAVSAGALPAGLQLDPASGALSGVPTTSGRSAFTVQVTDQAGATAQEPLDVTVSAGSGPDVLAGPVVGIAATPDGGGYWMADSAGSVEAFGDATWFGSMAGQPLNSPINHIVATPDGGGYWLVAADGGIFTFGDAPFFGSMGGSRLDAPVVDLAPASSGRGYWLVASDGGIFAFGTSRFHGSMGGHPLNRPVVGISADPATGGYWLVASDGGIFAFDAPFLGSTGDVLLNRPINGMTVTPDGSGYWFVASDGGIFAFGDARFAGSTGDIPLVQPVVGMATDRATGGYWLVASDGGVFAFGAPFLGAA